MYSKQRGPRRGQRSSFRARRPEGPQRRRSARRMPTFNPEQFINNNPQTVREHVYTPTHTFADFGLPESMVSVIHGLGITTPSPIQDQIIPHILNARDVVGIAETGTGKTAAFLIPLIVRAAENPRRQTLILTPTRELALQIEGEFQKLRGNNRLFSVTCVGGTNIRPQLQKLKRPQQFIIGTPGRILDLIERKAIRTEFINTVVLDEADRMLDMGFIHDMRKILEKTPKDRETLFFSATMPEEAKRLVSDFLTDPITVSVKKRDVTNSVYQDVIYYRPQQKYDALLDLFKDKDFSRVIIFGAMKHSVEKLKEELVRSGVKAESIHGNKNHGQRQRALTRFKNGEATVLVATDVAARGIHVDNVSHVINYDLPGTFEDYVHRIGRTGRGDKRGKALTFVAR